ncbi:MAG: SOS response-associated peptidase [Calditrichaeota bacterium]|nr:SOS response-associated peptidase [Calditrichota bacterium]
MCTRIAFFSQADLARLLPGLIDSLPVEERFNVAPSQHLKVVLNVGQRELVEARWGLIPHWAKDPSIAQKLINARSETIGEKPSFRLAVRRQRCLIWVSGFYEWTSLPGRKGRCPLFFTLKSGDPFAFAGLWNRWKAPDDDQPLLTATIVTTSANALIGLYHNRMPVIVPPSRYEEWLTPEECDPQDFASLFQPYPPGEMQVRFVSTMVNNPRNDRREVLEEA